MSHYENLVAHFTRLSHFHHLQAICGWDQAAMMPEGGNDARSAAMAELAVLCHKQLTEPSLKAMFEGARKESLNEFEQASLTEMERRWQQATVLPEKLVQQKSLAGSRCEHAWRTQRKNNDWEGFKENLKPVVELARQEALIRGAASGLSPYNAMLDLYEPGMTKEKLDPIFSDIKSWLPGVIEQIIEKQEQNQAIPLQGPFSEEKQNQLGLKIMEILGFDFNHGRLDVSTHPFCGGVPSDVRITTRYTDDDFTSSIMGIIHETGHARYEQGLPKQHASLPVGEARSMGIHESQSLFFEMQLSRSPAFVSMLTPLITETFGAKDNPAFSPENLLKIYTKVQKGFIRVDADEATYPAHVILRYEIERDLIEGLIEVDDIPAIWNRKMQEYLGISTEGNFTDGCMQDIHWTDGSFGYFPSYTLGAMYAAQFMASMRKTVDVDACIHTQNLAPIWTWLKDNIWSKGSTRSTEELVIQATGESLNPEYFKRHLIERYLND
ncbi:carboxypeptidase M32 [Parasalinivibrio latis]|uniref:carboxypeptidase M32 n=1 Tax=Parasalinivibrio latis TaxID=2952610 RepID=UPI0030DF4210